MLVERSDEVVAAVVAMADPVTVADEAVTTLDVSEVRVLVKFPDVVVISVVPVEVVTAGDAVTPAVFALVVPTLVAIGVSTTERVALCVVEVAVGATVVPELSSAQTFTVMISFAHRCKESVTYH